MINYESVDISAWNRTGMRNLFGEVLSLIGDAHNDLICLTADVASSAGLDHFRELFPDRFYNVGIAEQNMVGIAAGLAKEGFNVFITSFAPFVSLRPFEAIRDLIGYNRLNVKVVSLSAGLSMGVQGFTHYTLEDIALMQSVPGMNIYSPADCVEMAKCMEFLADYQGPAYLRLTGLPGSAHIHDRDYIFRPECPETIREGKGIAILGTGSIVGECVRSARGLKKDGIDCTVVNVHTIKPLNSTLLKDICDNNSVIVTVEEHFSVGGLGSIISDYISRYDKKPRLIRICVPELYPTSGSYSYLLDHLGLSAGKICDRIRSETGLM